VKEKWAKIGENKKARSMIDGDGPFDSLDLFNHRKAGQALDA
jgi:hypothetical protein